jgi:DNA topoisomerase-3
MDLQSLIGDQCQSHQWGTHAQRIHLNGPLQGPWWRVPRSGGHDDKAHPPIHPTKFSAGEQDWTIEKKRLYEFIVRSFLACCTIDAVGYETVVTVAVSGETFKAVGLMVRERNWLEVYPYQSWGDHGEMPDFHPGQTFRPEMDLKQVRG